MRCLGFRHRARGLSTLNSRLQDPDETPPQTDECRQGSKLESRLSKSPRRRAPPPSSARSGPAADRKSGPSLVAQSQPQRRGRLPVPCSFAHRLLREAVPPPGLTHRLKSEREPRRRRRFPEEVMGDEHGRRVLAPKYPCEEPSAPAGFLSSRPAGACRRGKRRRLRGDPSPIGTNKRNTKVGHYLPVRLFPLKGESSNASPRGPPRRRR